MARVASAPPPPSPAPYLALVARASERQEAALQRVIMRVARKYRGRADAAAPAEWQAIARDSMTLSPAMAIALGADLREAVAQAIVSGEVPPWPDADAIAKVAGTVAPAAAIAELRALDAAGMPAAVRAALLQPADPRVAVELARIPTRAQLVELGDLGGAATRNAELIRINVLNSPAVSGAISGWADESAALIKAIPQDRILQLPSRIEAAIVGGQRWEVVARELREQTGISRRHAELVARDQTARLNGKITESLQQAAGVEEYDWIANRDARVRKTHAAAALGGPYKWGDPEKGNGAPNVGFYGERGHPGQAGQCRCRARARLPDWWKEIQRQARADAAGARRRAEDRVCACVSKLPRVA